MNAGLPLQPSLLSSGELPATLQVRLGCHRSQPAAPFGEGAHWQASIKGRPGCTACQAGGRVWFQLRKRGQRDLLLFVPMPSAKQPLLRTPGCMPSRCNCKASASHRRTPFPSPCNRQGWVVDVREIQLLRAASGDPMELGSGATATVYKAKLRGETVAAKEIDLGRR